MPSVKIIGRGLFNFVLPLKTYHKMIDRIQSFTFKTRNFKCCEAPEAVQSQESSSFQLKRYWEQT